MALLFEPPESGDGARDRGIPPVHHPIQIEHKQQAAALSLAPRLLNQVRLRSGRWSWARATQIETLVAAHIHVERLDASGVAVEWDYVVLIPLEFSVGR